MKRALVRRVAQSPHAIDCCSAMRGAVAARRIKGDPGSAACCANGSEKLQNETFQIGFQTETNQPKRGTEEAACGLGYPRSVTHAVSAAWDIQECGPCRSGSVAHAVQVRSQPLAGSR